MHVECGEVVHRVREQAQPAGVASDSGAAGRDRVPDIVFPKFLRQPTPQPQPSLILSRVVYVRERP